MAAWQKKTVIGDCVLYLGDCSEIMQELDPADAVVTDPPFGMCFVSSFRRDDTKHKKIANDNDVSLLRWACEIPAVHSKYIFMRWDNLMDNIPKPKSVITWVKDNHSMGDLNHEHGRQTEVCAFYAGADHFFPSGRPNDVVKAPRTGNQLHPTQKPVGLMEVVVGWTSGFVCDPFMGSGSTAVACAKNGREFVGIEIDPDYYEIACKRVKEAYKQPDLFVAPPSKPVQESMF